MSDSLLAPMRLEAEAGGPRKVDRIFAWIHARQWLFVLVGILLQTAVLLTTIVQNGLPYFVGDRILLKVAPVDPRDLFRGDYVILAYDIARIPLEGIEGVPDSGNWWKHSRNSEESFKERTIYVTLEPDADGRHWHGTKISAERPQAGKFIAGKLTKSAWPNALHFGIEAFYVQEGEGKEWERLRGARQLSAEVALAPWGQAKLVRLVEDPVPEAPQ